MNLSELSLHFLGHTHWLAEHMDLLLLPRDNENMEAKEPFRGFQQTDKQRSHIFHRPGIADCDVRGLLAQNSAHLKFNSGAEQTAEHARLLLHSVSLHVASKMRVSRRLSSLFFQMFPARFIWKGLN